MFQTMGAYMPTPPPDLEPPVLWGDEEHVRSLFASSGAVLDFKRHVVEFVHASSESWVQHNEEVLGPIILARNALREQGRWDALRAELVALYEEANEARDGSMRVKAEYLVTLATMPS
jgi:hypothetical protein